MTGPSTPQFLDMLSASDREALLGIGGQRRAARGERLLHEGQVGADVLVLLEGHAKITASSAAGFEMILALRGPGTIIGEQAAIDGVGRSASVAALEPVLAHAVPADAFVALLHRRPSLVFALLAMTSERLRDSGRRRLEFAAGDTVARVASRLLELAADHGSDDGTGALVIDLPLTQEDLAGWCGASIESTSRALRTLREAGWVRTGRGSLVVLDAPALRARAA